MQCLLPLPPIDAIYMYTEYFKYILLYGHISMYNIGGINMLTPQNNYVHWEFEIATN